MPISVDELNVSFSRLKGPAVNGFERANPLWRALLEKDNMTDEGGTYWENIHVGGSPAQGRGLVNGDEILPMTTSSVTSKLQVEPYTIAAAINIPKNLLARNNGKRGIIKLVEAYPKATMDGIARDIHKYVLTGASAGLVFPTAELTGYSTLNGQFAAGTAVGTTNGYLQFLSPADQATAATLVQTVAKSVADNYFNQYEDCAAVANILESMQGLYARCAEYAAGVDSGPDLIYMDATSFANYRLEQRDIVRLTDQGKSSGGGNFLASPFGVGNIQMTTDLDLALFAGVAADGVSYFLNTDFIEIDWVQRLDVTEFREMIANQRVVTAHVDAQFAMGITKMTAQGVMSGGAA